MNLSTMCWLQPAHSGISAGRQLRSAPVAPPPPDRQQQQHEKKNYSFRFVVVASRRAASSRTEQTPGEVPGRTGINKKGSDGNGINPPSEPPAKL